MAEPQSPPAVATPSWCSPILRCSAGLTPSNFDLGAPPSSPKASTFTTPVKARVISTRCKAPHGGEPSIDDESPPLEVRASPRDPPHPLSRKRSREKRSAEAQR